MFSRAKSHGVSPAALCNLGFAPASSSASIASPACRSEFHGVVYWAATCRGVLPFSSRASSGAPAASVTRQSALPGISRSSFYYRPQPVSSTELALMRALDEVYTATPFYGSRRLQAALRRLGWTVNRKRAQRLMRSMGIEAVGPKPRLSHARPGHRVYPYLLRHVAVERVDQVWSCDITYIRLWSSIPGGHACASSLESPWPLSSFSAS